MTLSSTCKIFPTQYEHRKLLASACLSMALSSTCKIFQVCDDECLSPLRRGSSPIQRPTSVSSHQLPSSAKLKISRPKVGCFVQNRLLACM
eukprot:4014027-Pleurochrysis_carterae.AAC.4